MLEVHFLILRGYFKMSFQLCVLTVIPALILIFYLYFRRIFKYWTDRNVYQFKPFWNIFSNKPVSLTLANFHQRLVLENQAYGGIYIFGSPFFMPTEPTIIKDILMVNFAKFGQRGIYCDENVDPMSANLFSLHHDSWRQLRTKLTPAFSSGKLKAVVNIICECSKPLLEVVERKAETGEKFDAQDNFKRFTLDVIGSSIFGIEVNGFKNDNNDFKKYSSMILQPTGIYAFQFLICALSPNLASLLKIPQVHRDMTDFILKVIKDNIRIRKEQCIVRNDLFQILVNIKDKEDLTVEQLTATALVFLLAGFETSSSTISFCLYELARQHDIQDKVRKEIKTVLKKYNEVTTYEALQEMKYLQQVVDEALRKYPTLPHLNRECTENHTIPGTDVVIEKGTGIIISIYGLHYDPENYPDPKRFDPDRFSKENKRNIKPFTYIPFGEGPRNCVGMKLGLLQVKVGLVQVLKNHKFSLCPTTRIRFNRRSLTLVNDSPVNLFIQKC